MRPRIMRSLYRWAGSLALAGTLASAATPALADRGWQGGGYGGRGGYDRHWDRGRNRGGDGLGIFLGVAALVGAVAVVASSAAKDKKAAQNRAENLPPEPAVQPALASGSEDAAVDACAVAARDEGSQDGAYAEVRDITSTRPFDGGWAVDGTLDQRDGYRGQGVQRRFSCTWRDGRVADMILSRDTIALR